MNNLYILLLVCLFLGCESTLSESTAPVDAFTGVQHQELELGGSNPETYEETSGVSLDGVLDGDRQAHGPGKPQPDPWLGARGPDKPQPDPWNSTSERMHPTGVVPSRDSSR